jgi:hypothetical protein
MRRAAIVPLACAVVAAVALVVVAASDERELAYGRGVPAQDPVLEIPPGLEACQGPVAAPASFDALEVFVDPQGFPLVALDTSIRNAETRQLLSHGVLFPDLLRPSRQRIDLEVPVEGGDPVDICFINQEEQPALLLGQEQDPDPVGTLRLAGQVIPADLYLAYLEDDRSALDRLPQMFERAALWRPGWVGEWTYWLLLAGVALVVPGLLGWALWRAARDDGREPA